MAAIVLKYRVPARKGRERYEAPLQDAQRAFGIVRQRARQWKIDPDRVGIIGFSAGGHVAACLSSQHDMRTYPRVDDADDLSCRPSFTLLIYPAYLVVEPKGDNTLAAEVIVTRDRATGRPSGSCGRPVARFRSPWQATQLRLPLCPTWS